MKTLVRLCSFCKNTSAHLSVWRTATYYSQYGAKSQSRNYSNKDMDLSGTLVGVYFCLFVGKIKDYTT